MFFNWLEIHSFVLLRVVSMYHQGTTVTRSYVRWAANGEASAYWQFERVAIHWVKQLSRSGLIATNLLRMQAFQIFSLLAEQWNVWQLKSRQGGRRLQAAATLCHKPGTLITSFSKSSNMTSSGQPAELQSLIALVKTLTNAQMKEILRGEGLTVSGVKVSLQLRIIECERHISFSSLIAIAKASRSWLRVGSPTNRRLTNRSRKNIPKRRLRSLW